MKASLFFAAALLAGFQTIATAATYYVSGTGSDLASGTSPSQPWQTVSKVNAHAWAPGFGPGDTICFQGGQSFSGNIYLQGPTSSEPVARTTGTTGAPVTFTSYGTGRATLSVTGTSTTAIYAYNTAAIQIQNLNITGPGYAVSSGKGISFYADSFVGTQTIPGVSVSDADISGFSSGLEIGSWYLTGGYNGITIERVNSSSNKKTGIFVYGEKVEAHENVVVRHCNAWHNHGDGSGGNGILLNGVKTGLIEYCTAYENGAVGNGGVGIWTYGVDGVTIQFCESYNNRTNGGSDGGGFDFDGGTVNSVMQYNYSHGNDGAGYLFAQYENALPNYGPLQNNIVRYNVSENDGRKNSYGAFMFWGFNATNSVGPNHVYNNTVYVGNLVRGGTPAAVRFLGSNVTGITIRNNIFIATGTAFLVNADNSMVTTKALAQGNNWWVTGGNTARFKWGGTTHTSLSAWRTATSQEKIGTASVGYDLDPLLNAPGTGGTTGVLSLASLTAYKQQATSPMANRGLDLSSLFGLSAGPRDYYGNDALRGLAYDIGAHEAEETVTGWQNFYFSQAEQSDPAISGDTADPDADGGSNLLEYALDTNPRALASSARDLLASGTDQGVLTLTYERPKPNRPDISYSVEASSDLTAAVWQNTVLSAGYPFDNGDGTETVKMQDLIPISGTSARFLRLRVTRQ